MVINDFSHIQERFAYFSWISLWNISYSYDPIFIRECYAILSHFSAIDFSITLVLRRQSVTFSRDEIHRILSLPNFEEPSFQSFLLGSRMFLLSNFIINSLWLLSTTSLWCLTSWLGLATLIVVVLLQLIKINLSMALMMLWTYSFIFIPIIILSLSIADTSFVLSLTLRL